MRVLSLCVLLFAACQPALAQVGDKLPVSPVYKGEIRRGPDGKLFVLPLRSDTEGNTGANQTATLRVGPQELVTTITEAARAARDGDIIEIESGDYRAQPAVWTQNNLVIRGAGKRPVMIADGASAEGKAIWVIRGGSIRIENIEFRGARVADGNGSGIRFERGRLTVLRCAFFDNEMGLLTANHADMSLEVRDSEFGSAPRHSGQLHHLLYVGAIGNFVLNGSRLQNGYLGHLLKSRARENHITYNLLVDGPEGRSSYELELPNGGLAYVIGNIVGQSNGTDNPAVISYGAEGQRWPDNALYLVHNTLINDLHAGSFLKVWDEKFSPPVDTWVINNLLVGDGDLFPPAHGRFEGNLRAQRRDLIPYGGLSLRLKSDSPLRGSVRVPGQARGENLLPAAEFVFPAGTHQINVSSSLAPGALQ